MTALLISGYTLGVLILIATIYAFLPWDSLYDNKETTEVNVSLTNADVRSPLPSDVYGEYYLHSTMKPFTHGTKTEKIGHGDFFRDYNPRKSRSYFMSEAEQFLTGKEVASSGVPGIMQNEQFDPTATKRTDDTNVIHPKNYTPPSIIKSDTTYSIQQSDQLKEMSF